MLAIKNFKFKLYVVTIVVVAATNINAAMANGIVFVLKYNYN